MKEPQFKAAWDVLESKFALANALIEACTKADMTQWQVTEAIGTKQGVIARLESGKRMPSTRILERFAKATGTELRISFAPRNAGGSPRTVLR